VDPSPAKGAVMLQTGEDGLLHFIWKDRTSGDIEEDLILFPSDASFVKVPQSSWGRTYVLKFSSSNQRHFFWMQDASTRRDDEFVTNMNRLLEDPDHIPVWDASQPGEASTSTTPPGVTPDQLAQLRTLVSSLGRPSGASSQAAAPPDLSLTDVLTPANIMPIFTSHPELVPSLFPHLPPDMPVPPSEEALQRVISSPQFRSAVSSFDTALRTGMLGGLVRQLGLPEEAGTSVQAFLRAVQEQADRERGTQGRDNMDTN